MNFQLYFESLNFDLNVYYKLLNEFLISKKQWKLKKIKDDPYNQFEILNKEGKRMGKIERDYDPKNKTLFLNHIGVGFDDQGQRMKGLGLVDLVYGFEKELVKSYGIKKVCTEPVNEITERKFKETYKDYKLIKSGKYICALIQ